MIELLLVVAIIGIVASIAIPSLTRARGAAFEVSTIGALRALHSAQTAYSVSCAGGYYAPSIPNLAVPPPGGKAAYIGPEFKANVTVTHGYRITFTAGPAEPRARATCNGLAAGRARVSYFIGADLLTASGFNMVSRYFGVNHNGIIYESRKRIPVFLAGAPAAPARRIR